MDLGALIARVVVEDAEASRTLTLLMARFKSLGTEAGSATAGTTKLDEGLASVSTTANKATASLGRAAKATEQATATQRQLSVALAQVEKAALRETAAQERLNALQESGKATALQLTSAQSRLTAAQRASAAASDKVAAAERGMAVQAERDATAQEGRAAALARVQGVLASVAAESAKVQQTTLREVAAKQRLVAVSAEAGSAERAQAAETSRLASAQAGLVGSSAAAAKAQEASAARIAATGKKMSRAITLPVVAAAAVSVHEAMQFQKSMTLIQTAGGETEAKAKAIAAGLKVMSVQTGTSLDQLGEGIYTVAKAGAQKWSAAEQLNVLRVAAQGAKAEQVDLGTATDALSTAMLDYHTKASDAVKVENQLIRASGLAKTSFGLFTGSLSNVLPIASALGVSIPEVTGAIATMTQHGVSAQQATENLRNLLFNLSGQNNVAAQSMQQLGIDTVDLAKNLGTRGLSGTLAIVDAALKSHTKNGMVVIDVQKAAKLATQSLSTELGTFTGKLKDQSGALLSGKVGIKDYTSYAKSLGGVSGAAALQFLSLYKNSLGFSNQLKSGKGTITTTTAQYQKLLGGMTGASVAMQISGKYAKENAANVAAIGKAALEAGSDVLGWNKTQDTLAVKMDKAKASLQVMAVEIGTALIPAVSKIANVVGDAVHGFEGLSHTQKLVLGWSIGVLAAIGPVIAIGSRLTSLGRGIGNFTGGASSRLASLAGASESSSARINTSMRGVGSALGGAAIGLAVGELTKNANNGVKAIGVLGSAAAGAAVGFGAGGPLGAAIGGVAGGLTALATQFFSAGHAAHAAIKPTDEYTTALINDKNAVGANTEALIAHKLTQSGLYDAGLKLGLSQRTLTLAAEGNASALADVKNAQIGLIGSTGATELAGHKLTAAQKAALTASGQLTSGLAGLNTTLAVNKHAAENEAAGLGKLSVGLIDVSKKGTLTAANLVKLGGIEVDPKIKADPTKANLVIAGLTRDINAIRQSKNPKLNADSTLGKAVIHNLQAQINNLRQGKLPRVNVDTGPARSAVRSFGSWYQSYLGTLSGTIPAPHYASGAKPGVAGGIIGAHAAGGTIRGPGSGTSDSVLMYGSNGEEVINAKQAAKHRSLLKAINAGIDGFATGGTVGATQSWLRNTVNPMPYVWGAAGPRAYDCSGLVGGVFEHLTGRGHGRLFSTSNEGAVLRSLGFKHGSGGPNALMVAGWNSEHTTGSVGGLKFEAYGSDGVARKDQIRVGGNARDPKSFPNVMYLPNGSDGVKAGATKPGGDPKTGGAPAAAAVSTAKAAAGLFGSAGGGSGAGSFGSQLLTGVSTSGGSVGTSSQSVAASRAAVLANATGAVNSAITGGIAPDPTEADLIGSKTKSGVLANAIGSAYDQQKQTDIAGKNYAVLAAKVTALKTQIKGLTGASKTQINAWRDQADADTKQARALSTQASKMADSTKAQKAAKKAVEDHARALRDDAANLRTQATEATRNASASAAALRATLTAQLTAAEALATKAKDTYGTISQAAKDAVAKAADYAKTLVADIQADADALQQTFTDYASSITSGLTQGTDLASVWGAINDAATASAAATGELTSAQAAQSNATATLTAAQQQLAVAQAAVAAGTGTPAQYAALTAAQQAQTTALTVLTMANSNLATAQQAVASSGTAVQGGLAGLQAQFNTILTNTQNFAADLQSLAGEGADQSFIAQIAGMGTQAGDALAQQLLAAGPAGIAALQTTLNSIQKVAGDAGTQLAGTFYGSGVTAMKQFIAGLQKQFPALSAALAAIGAQVAGLTTGATAPHKLEQSHTVGWLAANYHETVAQLIAANPSLAKATASSNVAAGTTLTVPKFAAGVENFGGGLAYVHAGETLVNLRPGTDVVTARQTRSMFDTSGIERRLDVMAQQQSTLAERIGEVQLQVIDRYGQAHARQQLVAARGRSPF